MKIHLQEITEQETDLDFTEDEEWVLQAISRVDEAPQAGNRTADVHFRLHKVDGVVVVSGSIKTSVHLVCSRCANSYALDFSPKFSALFCQDRAMAGISGLDEKGRPQGQNHGYARHEHDTNSDLDITYLSGDCIDLSEVVTEQLRLQLPFQPLCSTTCKGICANCGTDLNSSSCNCAGRSKSGPFAVLENLNVKN